MKPPRCGAVCHGSLPPWLTHETFRTHGSTSPPRLTLARTMDSPGSEGAKMAGREAGPGLPRLWALTSSSTGPLRSPGLAQDAKEARSSSGVVFPLQMTTPELDSASPAHGKPVSLSDSSTSTHSGTAECRSAAPVQREPSQPNQFSGFHHTIISDDGFEAVEP